MEEEKWRKTYGEKHNRDRSLKMLRKREMEREILRETISRREIKKRNRKRYLRETRRKRKKTGAEIQEKSKKSSL